MIIPKNGRVFFHLVSSRRICQRTLSDDRGPWYELNDDQRSIADLAKRFAIEEIIPKAAEHDRTGEYPYEIFRKGWELGFVTPYIPKAYGGLGLSVMDRCLIGENLSYGCSGISAAITVNGLAQAPLVLAGTDEQKREYLGRCTSEPIQVAYGATEPSGGSDMWISNGGLANWLFVLARTDPNPKAKKSEAFTGFIVEGDSPGLIRGRKERMMGQRASNTTGLTFENVIVPKRNVVGQVGKGFPLVMSVFDQTRAPVASYATGVAQRALDEATRYSMERKTFGTPIAGHQAIQFLLAEAAIGVETARMSYMRAAWEQSQGRSTTYWSSIAKAYSADVCNKIVTDAVQIFGGAGFNAEYPVEKLMRDAKVFQIYEGTAQIQRMIIARQHLKHHSNSKFEEKFFKSMMRGIPKPQLPLNCSVCGDKPSGINFNVPTCVSCKAFFRRHALSNKTLVCLLSGRCRINTITRKFCSKCRLDKCLSVGMRKELIQTNEKRQQIRERAQMKRLNLKRKETKSESESSSLISNNDSPSIGSLTPSTTIDDDDDEEDEEFKDIDSCDSIFEYDFTNDIQELFGIGFNTIPSELMQYDEMIESSQQPELEKPQLTTLPNNPFEYELSSTPAYELANDERHQLMELTDASQWLNRSSWYNETYDYRTICEPNPFMTSFIIQYFLHRLIRMSKRLEAFSCLTSSDQKALFKRSLLQMVSIRSAQLYDQKQEAWFSVDDKFKVIAIVPVSIYKPYCYQYSFERHQQFPNSFRDEWKQDSVIFDLLTVIVLFEPYAEYCQQEIIRNHQQRYKRLLLRYLTNRYNSTVEAERSYQILMNNIDEMRTLHVDVRNFFSHSTFRSSPLFCELLSLV
ncbi:hypothetical protein RDWZM_007483 [Blomia tropicalis]|uniref:Nuclear receptor domain-containing protein n=1 Tax=Blomia tropicalis TaxID=40697 RepID=A0A9Q0RKH1_BLOTA|nr:hypothetical protein RDWZM_007483 [Blomia tropicalis]